MVHVWHCFADFCQRTAPSHPSQAEARRALATFRHLWSDPPELETIGINCLFDRFAGKIIGRSALGPNPSNLLPGAKLIRQFAARRVSDESSEASACLRSEDIKSHGISSFAICLGHLRCHCGFANLPSLLFRRGDQPVPHRLLTNKFAGAARQSRPFLASPSPTAFHRSAAASFRGTRLRAAFSSLRREEPDQRYCRERGHAYALLRRRSKRIGCDFCLANTDAYAPDVIQSNFGAQRGTCTTVTHSWPHALHCQW